LYGLDRFSEDIDFSLLSPRRDFKLNPYLDAIKAELNGMDFNVHIAEKSKSGDATIESAFIKAGTKEHLLKIEVPEQIAERIAKNDLIKVKFEVDIDPPGGFETEAKMLLQPIPFSVTTYQEPDLFAGKIHAVLQRSWRGSRVKGRDFYDFVWYIGRSTPVHLSHLEQRLRQTNGWTSRQSMTQQDLLKLLHEKFSNVNFDAAKKDVSLFIKDPHAVDVWSTDFFLGLLPRLIVC
jgi:predicted nucleotidyltransferase component of viral defense system